MAALIRERLHRSGDAISMTSIRQGGSREGDPNDCRTVRTDEGTVAYAEYGDPSGDPVVFLHGTPGCRVGGRLFADRARDLGVRLLAPDRPGYGRSSPQPDRTLADVAPLVERVLDDAGVDRAGAVGFSGGGPHALALSATVPDRIGRVDVISGAVPPALAGDRPLPLRALETLAARAPALVRWLFAVQSRLAGHVPGAVLGRYTDEPGAVPDADAAVVVREFRKAFARHRQGIVTESRLLAREWPVDPAPIDRPVSLWHGRRDTNVPLDGARRLADRLPEGELTVCEGDHLRTVLRTRERVLGAHAGEDR